MAAARKTAAGGCAEDPFAAGELGALRSEWGAFYGFCGSGGSYWARSRDARHKLLHAGTPGELALMIMADRSMRRPRRGIPR